MNLREYIKENRDELELEGDLDKVWAGIESRIGVKPQKLNRSKMWLVATSVLFALLVLGGVYFGGKPQKEKPTKLQYAQWENHMQNEPTSGKIKWVNHINEKQDYEPDIIRVLIRSFLEDESVLVRIACLEKLGSFTEHEEVRVALIQSLNHQENARLLLSTLKVIERMQLTEANSQVKKLSEQHENEWIRNEAKNLSDKLIEL